MSPWSSASIPRDGSSPLAFLTQLRPPGKTLRSPVRCGSCQALYKKCHPSPILPVKFFLVLSQGSSQIPLLWTLSSSSLQTVLPFPGRPPCPALSVRPVSLPPPQVPQGTHKGRPGLTHPPVCWAQDLVVPTGLAAMVSHLDLWIELKLPIIVAIRNLACKWRDPKSNWLKKNKYIYSKAICEIYMHEKIYSSNWELQG